MLEPSQSLSTGRRFATLQLLKHLKHRIEWLLPCESLLSVITVFLCIELGHVTLISFILFPWDAQRNLIYVFNSTCWFIFFFYLWLACLQTSIYFWAAKCSVIIVFSLYHNFFNIVCFLKLRTTYWKLYNKKILWVLSFIFL